MYQNDTIFIFIYELENFFAKASNCLLDFCFAILVNPIGCYLLYYKIIIYSLIFCLLLIPAIALMNANCI